VSQGLHGVEALKAGAEMARHDGAMYSPKVKPTTFNWQSV
jgi:hypothetical protein